ncbi:MAG: hypothetical protein HWN67_07300 [Candidatus Helarchaeota archaeon]|nr:hypothetical protein [Candidatus Helarchaeota archaeon]
MENKYLYVLISLIIWFVVDLIFLFLNADYFNYFIASLILMGINLIIFAVGYINYKMHEKPYSIMYFINSIPLILSFYYNLIDKTLIFILMPIIIGIIFIIVMAITKKLGGFDFDKIVFLECLLIIPLLYLANLIIIIIYGTLGIQVFPFPFGLLIYPLNYIFLIILIGTAR